MWVKTTVYEYICANYGVHPEPGTTIMADTPVSEEEYAFPKLEGLPDDTPLGKLRKDEVWFLGLGNVACGYYAWTLFVNANGL